MLVFIVVGFIAQMIDGALGMAYGVSSNTFLLSLGIPPAVASASVHAAEVVTTGISGLSHWRFGNVHLDLVKRLLIPGVVGGVIGAYLLSSVDATVIKPFVAVYLMVMGLVILGKAFAKPEHREVRTGLIPLGFVGGLMDAIGGGGWGPIVTSTLVARGNNPRFTVGSVNATEFFVTVSESLTFILAMSSVYLDYGKVILGLLIGGVLAAPLAAFAARKLPRRPFMVLVGLLIIVLSARTLYLAWM
jgi:uncharacterized membrane protein YfcA